MAYRLYITYLMKKVNEFEKARGLCGGLRMD